MKDVSTTCLIQVHYLQGAHTATFKTNDKRLFARLHSL